MSTPAYSSVHESGEAESAHPTKPRGQWQIDWPAWRSFGIALVALVVALALALYSRAAAETGGLLSDGDDIEPGRRLAILTE